MEEEEQVIGVLGYCDVCQERTVHVDGVCRDHKVIRRRRAPAEGAATVPPPRRRAVKPKPKPRAPFGLGSVLMLLVIAGVVVALGAIHIVHSSANGYSWCRKAHWSLSHNLLDLDHLSAEHLDAPVLAALAKCRS